MPDLSEVAALFAPKEEPRKGRADLYGTVRAVESDGAVAYDVKLDGAPDYSPFVASVEVHHGDRVLLRNVNGTLVAVANLTVPSVNDEDYAVVKDIAHEADELLDGVAAVADAADKTLAEIVQASNTSNGLVSGMKQAADTAGTTLAQIVSDADSAAGTLSDMQQAAQQAGTTLNGIYQDAADAKSAAQQAIGDAATAAQQATQATGYANAALVSLSEAQDVIGVVNWITEHGTYSPTQDADIVPGKVYYTRTGSGTSQDPYVYAAVAQPEASALGTYYELSIDQALSQFVASHLSLTNDGLFVLKDGSSWKTLYKADGFEIRDAQNAAALSVGASGFAFDNSRPWYVGSTSGFVAWTPASGSTPGQLSIGGANVVIGGARTLDEMLADIDAKDVTRSASGRSVTTPDTSELPLLTLDVDGESVQDGTPSPSAPVPIRCVRGRNLADVSNVYSRWIEYTSTTQARWIADSESASIALRVIPGRTYYVKNYNPAVTILRGCCLSQLPSGSDTALSTHAVSSPSGFSITPSSGENYLIVQTNYSQLSVGKALLSVTESTYAFPDYIPYGHLGVVSRGRNVLKSWTWAFAKASGTVAVVLQDSGGYQGRRAYKLECSADVSGWAYHYVTLSAEMRNIIAALPEDSYISVSWKSKGDQRAVPYGFFGIINGNQTKSLTKNAVTRRKEGTVDGWTEWVCVMQRNALTDVDNQVLYFQTGSQSLPRPGDVGYICDVQLAFGDPIGIDYEPYRESVSYIDLQGNELHALDSTYRDELRIDASGHAVIEKRCGVLFGDFSVTNYGALGDGTSSFKVAEAGASSFALSNIATLGSSDMSARMAYSGLDLYMRLSSELVGSTAASANTYLNSNGVKVIYPLATPETVDLGYVTLPTPFDGGTVHVSAEVQPVIAASWWTQAGAEAGAAHIAASRSEARYITAVTDGGIWLTPEGAKPVDGAAAETTTGWHISDVLEYFKQGASWIKLWVENSAAKLRLGLASSRHILMQDGGIDVMQDATTSMAHFGYGSGNSGSGGTAVAPYYTLGSRGNGAVGNLSVAEGFTVVASGANSHAEGMATEASGDDSHAEGLFSQASGGESHAEGNGTEASGSACHAEGYYATATRRYNHAEGYRTTSDGQSSHAEGERTHAGCYASHAAGIGTIATGVAQVAIGMYNVEDSAGWDMDDESTWNPTSLGDYALIVGNGTGDNARSNAMAVARNGDVRIGGHVRSMGGALKYSEPVQVEDIPNVNLPAGDNKVIVFTGQTSDIVIVSAWTANLNICIPVADNGDWYIAVFDPDMTPTVGTVDVSFAYLNR